jgi:small subunit ribosomal protein S4e
MHQTRAQTTTKIPIPRKGTKFVARSFGDLQNSVPVVVAVRDMLKLAQTSAEVKKMINKKSLKINGKEVKDARDSIRLFNVLEADKTYVLTLTDNGRFALEESKSKDRMCKVINKTILRGKITQLNLHDGSNVISKDKVAVQDTLYLGLDGKISKHVSLEKGKECFVISGKYLGKKGKIESVENGTAKVKIGEYSLELEKRRILAL